MTATKAKKPTKAEAERQEAIEWLRNVLKPGDKIDVIIRRVSASGMTRLMDFYLFDKGCERRYLTGMIATACGYKRKDSHLKVEGCGMDMGFSVVYNLSRVMFPAGFGVMGHNDKKKVRQRPKYREDIASMKKRGFKFRGRNGDTSGWDKDGGYGLEHRYL